MGRMQVGDRGLKGESYYSVEKAETQTVGAQVYRDLCKHYVKIGSCALLHVIIMCVIWKKRECCPYLREREQSFLLVSLFLTRQLASLHSLSRDSASVRLIAPWYQLQQTRKIKGMRKGSNRGNQNKRYEIKVKLGHEHKMEVFKNAAIKRRHQVPTHNWLSRGTVGSIRSPSEELQWSSEVILVLTRQPLECRCSGRVFPSLVGDL